MARAAAPVIAMAGRITPDQLAAPTPCAGFDVRRLVNHLLFWGPSLEGAGRKEAVAPPAASEHDVDLTGEAWAADLAGQLERIVAAWSHDAAWEGTTRMGSPMELPASLVGGMVVGELVVHGWDLARATRQPFVADDDVAAYTHDEIAKNAEQGREIGVYGPVVRVAATAPALHRLLGLTGRDPAWAS
jgi:uncharacterized protein (TIGR03086 family)